MAPAGRNAATACHLQRNDLGHDPYLSGDFQMRMSAKVVYLAATLLAAASPSMAADAGPEAGTYQGMLGYMDPPVPVTVKIAEPGARGSIHFGAPWECRLELIPGGANGSQANYALGRPIGQRCASYAGGSMQAQPTGSAIHVKLADAQQRIRAQMDLMRVNGN